MGEEEFRRLLSVLERDDVAPTPETMQRAAKLLRVYREALGWVASHDSVSVAAAKRKQRVAAGACFFGKRPGEVLAESDR